jgi:tetratricopeptide (TPR) repeat protein
MAPKNSPKKSAKVLHGEAPAASNEDRKRTLVLFDKAVKLMKPGSYDKAHVVFNEMLAIAPQDLADRIRMYIAACVAQLDKGKTEFRTHEERYDFAISLLNMGHYPQAHEQLQHILLEHKTADYAFYGLALLASMTRDTHKCIEHLTEAIRLNAQNRIQARSDSDFADVADDPMFTELLYPEATA